MHPNRTGLAFATLAALVIGMTLIPQASLARDTWCADPTHNYCPGQTICDVEPGRCQNTAGCEARMYVWVDAAGGGQECLIRTWDTPGMCGGRGLDRWWVNSDCDPISQEPPGPRPNPGPGNQGGGPTPPPSAQPLVLITGTGLLDCPVGALDCRSCSGQGGSDAASCGASGFNHFMIESIARQAGASQIADENLERARTLQGNSEGVQSNH